MSAPTETGWYWTKGRGLDEWAPMRVVKINDKTLVIDDRECLFDYDPAHVRLTWAECDKEWEWGPRIEVPDMRCPTESCGECGGRGWEYARPIT